MAGGLTSDTDIRPEVDRLVQAVTANLDLQARAEWDAAYINDLPDSAFAVVLPGGEKDDEGRTVPRDLRKLPHHNAAGDVDMPHLRNALSREPQSDMPEAMHARAQSHLQAHMPEQSDRTTAELVGDIQVRDMAKRELDVRILPWDTVIQTSKGTEEFRRGAFDHVQPENVLLMGLEHEAHFGIGQGGEPVLTRHPVGKGKYGSYENRPDGPHMTFRVAGTQRGDEVLALAAEGIVRHVSAEFLEVPGGTLIERRNGRRHKVHTRADLVGLSTTYRPAYGEQAAVLAVRSQETEGEAPMAEAQEAPAAPAAPIVQVDSEFQDKFMAALGQIESRAATRDERVMDRLEKLEERARMEFTVPSPPTSQTEADIHKGKWFNVILRMMTGERVSDVETRTLADLITSDNIGVVPPTYSNELIGIIDPSRPFMDSTRRLPTPDTGMSLILPKIVSRPTVGQQTSEKAELTSTPTSITSATFNAVTKGGAGDISLQLLKRSSPSYLSLYLELLAEAYAIDADDEAVDALLNESTVVEGGELDPEDLTLGGAWENAIAVSRRLAPDRIWLSSAAVQQFIDAKATTTNAPLYSNLEANVSAGGGPGGTISGLRPVHVPALDDEAVDVIVGPSRGFAWAEDGTFTLQVDVPGKAGRDVALVGILWFAPLYPAAFTTYTLPAS